jgi:multiple sugar transport system permease protein
LVGKKRVRLREYRTGILFLLPFAILFILFVLVPVIIALWTSFTNYNMLQDAEFIGITNYVHLFMDDDVFLIALENTLWFACITGPIGYILSFLAAWVIDSLRFKRAFALAFYVPSITSGVAMSAVWLYFFSSDRYGLINNFLFNIGLISEPILWTIDTGKIMTVIMIVQLWMSMGTGFLVFMAGLQNVNREYYEAGAIGGIRSRFQELWYITLPMMKPQLLFGAINAAVGAFGVFDIAVAIAGMPSPNYAAHTIVAHLYDYAFIRFQMGYASAVAMILFVMTFVLGQVLMKALSTKD